MAQNKIIVIEDDSSVRENLIQILTANGYNVKGKGSGKEGIELIIKEVPELIICDIMLPDISGYEILEFLNNSTKFKTTPFIFLTAKVEMSDLRKGMNLGADDYLTKPFHIKDLLEVVKIRINKSKLRTSDISRLSINSNRKIDLNQRLFLQGGGSAKFVIVSDIKYINSEGASTYVHISESNKILINKLLKDWEKILPVEYFVRINKTTIVNINFVQKVEKWFHNSYRLFLEGSKDPFLISNQYTERIINNYQS